MRFLILLLAFVTLGLSSSGCETLQGMLSTQKAKGSTNIAEIPKASITLNVLSPTKIKNLNNVMIYLLDLDVHRQCGCPSCFLSPAGSEPGDECDDQVLNDLKNNINLKKTITGKPIEVPQGDYYVLITEKINNIERPIWSTKIQAMKASEVFAINF
jgi:hypothetical protein